MVWPIMASWPATQACQLYLHPSLLGFEQGQLQKLVQLGEACRTPRRQACPNEQGACCSDLHSQHGAILLANTQTIVLAHTCALHDSPVLCCLSMPLSFNMLPFAVTTLKYQALLLQAGNAAKFELHTNSLVETSQQSGSCVTGLQRPPRVCIA